MDLNIGSVQWEGGSGGGDGASFLLRLVAGDRVRARVNGTAGDRVHLTVRGHATPAFVRSGPPFQRGDVIELELLQNDAHTPVFRFLGFVSRGGDGSVPPALPAISGEVQAALFELGQKGGQAPEVAEALLRLLALPVGPTAVRLARAFLGWRRTWAAGARGNAAPPGLPVLDPAVTPADLAQRLQQASARMTRPLEAELLRGVDSPEDPRAALLTSARAADREAADRIQGQQLLASGLPFTYLTAESPDGSPLEIEIDRQARQAGDRALRARVRLTLPGLGCLELGLHLLGEHLSVTIATETDAAAEKLEGAAGLLEEPLRALGIRLVRLEAVMDPELRESDFWARSIAEAAPAPAVGGLDVVI